MYIISSVIIQYSTNAIVLDRFKIMGYGFICVYDVFDLSYDTLRPKYIYIVYNIHIYMKSHVTVNLNQPIHP